MLRPNRLTAVAGVAFLMSLSVAPTTFAKEPTTVRVNGFDLPKEVAQFELRQVLDNERSHPGLGYTVFYNTPGVKVSLYLYNLQGPVPEGVGDTTREHFVQTHRDILSAHPDGELLGKARYAEAGGVPVMHAAYGYEEDREKVTSHLFLTALRNNFVKIRATYDRDHDEQGWAMLHRFVEAFFAGITKPEGKKDK